MKTNSRETPAHHPAQASAERTLLRQRSFALAKVPQQNDRGETVVDCITFLLGKQLHAFESSHVREIAPIREITPLPTAPPFVAGIISLRAEIVPVFNLKIILELAAADHGAIAAIILHEPQWDLAVMADQIIGTAEIDLALLLALPTTATPRQHRYVKGVTANGLVVLDASAVLNDEQLVVSEEIGG